MADVLRVAVIFGGGMVVGVGFVILSARSSYCHAIELYEGRRAMRVLMLVNVLVMAYVAASLLERWEEPLSWRWFAAAAIFAAKAWFFTKLRGAGLESERRVRYGAPGG